MNLEFKRIIDKSVWANYFIISIKNQFEKDLKPFIESAKSISPDHTNIGRHKQSLYDFTNSKCSIELAKYLDSINWRDRLLFQIPIEFKNTKKIYVSYHYLNKLPSRIMVNDSPGITYLDLIKVKIL
jgi:hypothetical protein